MFHREEPHRGGSAALRSSKLKRRTSSRREERFITIKMQVLTKGFSCILTPFTHVTHIAVLVSFVWSSALCKITLTIEMKLQN